MTYRGYELRHVPYKAPYSPATTSLAVIGPDGRAHLVRDEETGKHMVDTMVKAGKWPERESNDDVHVAPSLDRAAGPDQRVCGGGADDGGEGQRGEEVWGGVRKMPDGYKQARPFSNGSEADFFEENFCMRCVKCKPDQLTLEPSARSCPTYRATVRAYIDTKFWPKDGCIMEDPKGRRVCVDFYCEDPEVMEGYAKEFPQTYLGHTLKNLEDGFLALNSDGSPALRCGSKKNLETMLLVISADKERANMANTEEKV